ncbi:phosphoribosyltransferase [Capnocytophaga sp. H4358]|uniref:phosphoribosyltransferase family protein n=1 Tax=Capnocytophaga TaxID=1016 RepID=UPI000BB1D191|nr:MULTISPECIES: phosphoribosyltransferase family protein [Capnocytophaga]ATA72202.1 phosphoribosyltransferase [Capnocytophaga sp. H4358]GIM61750.1 phosphoribosyltransferase [Capnocytophaga canis]
MTTILNHQDIENKIRRIAYQIYEKHLNESEIILAGIEGNGYLFAEKLNAYLSEICSLKVALCKVKMNKRNPLEGISTSIDSEDYKNKSVVLVDDVLNSGLTLIYGVKHFLEVPLKRLTTAVLVNRNHKNFPIKADFKGISLSTSLQEHISVDFTEGNYVACLN